MTAAAESSARWHVRPWVEGDLGAIVRIEDASFADPWTEAQFRQEFAISHSRCLVAEDGRGGEIAAFCLCWVVADELHLLILAVEPAWRRSGLGRHLLGAMARWVVAEGVETVSLEVRPSNTVALAFYENLGFELVGRRRGYYRNGEDAELFIASIEELLTL